MTFWNRFSKIANRKHAKHLVGDLVGASDLVKRHVGKKRSASENIGITSRWTVTKNRGRPDEKVIVRNNLIPTAGLDFIMNRIYNATIVAGTHVDHLGLSANSATPLAANTTFPNEITTGGLERVIASSDHVAGTALMELDHEFTATAAITGIHKAALFATETSTQPIHVIVFADDDSDSDDVDLAIGDTLTVEIDVTYTAS